MKKVKNPRIKDLLAYLKGVNRAYLLIGIGIFVIVIALIVQLFSSDGIQRRTEPIDQPYNYDDSVRIVFDRANIEDNVKQDRANAYTIKKVDHSELIQQFLNKIGKGFWRKRSYDGVFYVWAKDANENFYIADYDPVNSQLFLRFEDPVELEGLSDVTSRLASSPASILEKVFYEYFDMSFNFDEPKVSTFNRETRIEARRLVDGIPLEVPGRSGYTDYLILDQGGRLKEANFLLLELEDASRVDLFSVELLGQVINRSDYPKDVIVDLPIGLDLTSLGYEPYDYASDFLGDPPPLDLEDVQLTPETCKVTSIELVYYFVRTTTEKLTPSYKVLCRGEVDVKGKQYSVPVTIFSNAIDPELVYVPGNL